MADGSQVRDTAIPLRLGLLATESNELVSGLLVFERGLVAQADEVAERA